MQPRCGRKNSHVKLLSILMLNLILFGGYQIPHSDLYTNACRIKAEHKDAKEQNNLGWVDVCKWTRHSSGLAFLLFAVLDFKGA